MAVSFSDLHTEAGLKALDAFLSGKSYISGGKFTKDDVKVYAAVQGKPSDSFPNASKWYNAVSSHLASSFPGKAAGVGVGCAAGSSSAKEAPAASGGDDDDLDLFGDETEDEKKAADYLCATLTDMGYVESPSDSPGLVVKKQDRIQSFLLSASSEPGLPQDLKDLASSLLSRDNVPYAPLRRIWFKSQPSSRPKLIFLFSGCEFVFSSPKQRERSDELKARLRKLEELAERKAYQELVKDITPKREANEPFSSYKDQLGFGMHVGLVMFTGYLVGHAAFRALFDRSPAMSAAGGILGLVGGMLVETLLFIIKASDQTPKQ